MDRVHSAIINFRSYLTQKIVRFALNHGNSVEFLKVISTYFTVQICFKMVLTLQRILNILFCYILAFKRLHFSRLFSLNFATRRQISSPFYFRIRFPAITQFFMQKSIVVCRRVKTDTQTHPCFKIRIRSHSCT